MKRWVVIILFTIYFVLSGCQKNNEIVNEPNLKEVPASGAEMQSSRDNGKSVNVMQGRKIYLYGEKHAVESILNKEFDLWRAYYHNNGMRHLFIELPYYTAEYLNIWMHKDNDDILKMIYDSFLGTNDYSENVLAFYKKIKADCPETIFHGIDVGHQYNTIGKMFLNDILKSGKDESSEEYQQAKICIEQGKKYYGDGNKDHVYRENTMVKNFVREYSKVNGEDIMGIFGGAHTDLDAVDYMTKTVPCMANQLRAYYNNSLFSEDLSVLAQAESVDVIKAGKKEYKAYYYGKRDFELNDHLYRRFWMLEDAYNDFKDYPKKKNVLPYDNYPMKIERGHVYAIEYTKKDGTVRMEYHRADGTVWNNRMVTEEIQIPEEIKP